MSEIIASPPRLKGRSAADTRSSIVDIIRSEGEISRTELARRTSLTEATISKVVKTLLEDGIVIEGGLAKSTGGKRAVLLRLNDSMLFAVGVTLDLAQCVLVLCSLDGAEIDRCTVAGTGQDRPSTVVDRVADEIRQMLERHSISPESIVGVGLASGGRRGVPIVPTEVAALADEYERYPTSAELADRTGFLVVRENDANCAALGEYWTTGGSPARDFATVYMAQGIGCGIIIGGTIYRGSSGNAGEIGHTLAVANGPLCWCGRQGCLTTVASPRAVTEQILASPTLSAICDVTDDTPFGETFQRFEQRVKEGNRPVRRLFQATADHLAGAVSNLVNTLDLDLVSLAGPGFAELGEEFREVIDVRLTEVAFMRAVHPITVRLGRGSADAAALGAASVVLHHELTPHRVAARL